MRATLMLYNNLDRTYVYQSSAYKENRDKMNRHQPVTQQLSGSGCDVTHQAVVSWGLQEGSHVVRVHRSLMLWARPGLYRVVGATKPAVARG